MSKEKKPDLKVVDFVAEKKKREPSEDIPDFVLEKIKLLKKAAKNNTLNSIILHFDYINKDGDLVGGNMLWDAGKDILKLLALADLIHDAARQHAMYEIINDDEDED